VALKAMKEKQKKAPATRRLLLAVWLTGFLFSSPASAAPDIEELSFLSFGTLAVPDNSSVSTYTFSRSGRPTIEGSVIVISPGSTGRLRLTGFPQNVGIEIDADLAALTAGGTGVPEPLMVISYDFGEVRSNAEGSVDVVFGGTWETSGNGGTYEDALYLDTAQFRFTFWNPDINDFAVVSKIVNLETTLSTGLNIEDVQSLHFGTLFARTTADDQASLTLSPQGEIALNNPGEARLASLSQPEPGIVMITGAAANRELSVVPQSGDVLLENAAEPSAPHFILSALVTALSNGGRTDDDGNLEIRIGGTLTTEETGATTVYSAGRYEGTYTVEISY
jgi:hypothetical protein